MKTKHIILRERRPRTREAFLGAPRPEGMNFMAAPAARDFAEPAVEVDELDLPGIRKLTEESGTIAVAPAMPMKLVEPMASVPVNPAAAAVASWGVEAVEAHTSPFSGRGVVVAVLDTGIDAGHAAFSDPDLNLITADFTGEGVQDTNGHGTHCAGTIFGRDVLGRRVGVARGVRKALVGKVLGSSGGSSDDIVRAILWAVTGGAHVISMSLGIDFPGYVRQLTNGGTPVDVATSRALQAFRLNVQLFDKLAGLVAAQAAFGQPTMLIAAGGNESRLHINASYDISVSPPAVAEGFVSVGALKRAPGGLTRAEFSNSNPDVAAPGVEIVSAWPGNTLRSLDGTSMATPHVAGVAALWAEQLLQAGNFSAFLWTSRLIGAAVTSGLRAGFSGSDVGAGLVKAPQS